MSCVPNDNERDALNDRRQRIDRRLRALAAQKKGLDQAKYDQRYNALLSEIREVERCLANLHVDELSLQHMEGNE